MVRHTHRRRQSRGRRRNTRRSRRTQRGGFSFSFSSLFGSGNLAELQQELAAEQNPIKKAEIQEKISIKQAEEIKKRTVEEIERRGANGPALSSTNVDNNMTRNSAGQFQSSAANGMGMGAAASSNMFRGGRRKSRRYRRK